jgi:acyl carrier protein
LGIVEHVKPLAAVAVDELPGWVAFDGRPLPSVDARVLDTDLRPVPTGVVGELCVAGAAVPDGFDADPARTAERLVPDPLGTGGSRLYRTGRLARFAGDGTLEDLGPAEPAELYRVRELLDADLAVLDSRVVSRRDEPSGRWRILGFVRTRPGIPFDPEEARRALAERRLPRRLIPEVLTPVESWPLDAFGLADTDRLAEIPDPGGTPGDDVADDGERPWDDMFESLLLDALAAVAYLGRLTPGMALADAGLDSFGFVGLLVALEQTYGITIPDEFPIVDMFRTPGTLWETVAGLRA